MAIQKFNAVDGFSTGLTMTNVIDSAGNISGVAGTFSGTFTGATASFSKLLTVSAGLSAAGGVTFSGNFSGATGTFSKLLIASAGLSAGGNVVFNAVTAVFGASAANTTPITVYKDNSTDNPAVDDGFGNTSFDTPNNKVPLTLSFTEVYDPNTGLTASTPGSTMIRVRDQTAGSDTFTVTDLGNIVCGNITCGGIAPTSFGGNLSIDAGNFITLNYDGDINPPIVLSVYNSLTSTNTLTLNGEGTFSKLTTSGTVSGATGAFSKLLSASAGLSASGATFSGNVTVNSQVVSTNARGWFL